MIIGFQLQYGEETSPRYGVIVVSSYDRVSVTLSQGRAEICIVFGCDYPDDVI